MTVRYPEEWYHVRLSVGEGRSVSELIQTFHHCCQNHIRAEVSLTSCEKEADGQPSCHPDFWGPRHSGRPLVAGGHKCLPPSARCERNITYLSPTPSGCQTPAVSVLWLQQMSFKAVAEHFWISIHFRIGHSSTSTFPLPISPDKEFICEYPISESHFRGINSRATDRNQLLCQSGYSQTGSLRRIIELNLWAEFKESNQEWININIIKGGRARRERKPTLCQNPCLHCFL